jgi:hypothetical protein
MDFFKLSSEMISKERSAFIVMEEDNLVYGINKMFFFLYWTQVPSKSLHLSSVKKI